MPGAPTKAVLWSRKAVLAVLMTEVIMLETDAGDDPTDGKFVMPFCGPRTQFCAWAPVAANSETAAATPTRSPLRNFPLV